MSENPNPQGNPPVELIEAVIENMQVTLDDWESFTMSFQFNDKYLYSTSGYLYNPTAHQGTAVGVMGVEDAMEAYLAEVNGPGATLPAAMLLQFDRPSGKCEVTFEESNGSRWSATPANFETLAEELRPQFD